MREEEVSDASWFALPEDGDEDVDWTSFTVDIEGPVSAWVKARKESVQLRKMARRAHLC